MAVIDVEEIPESRSGGISATWQRTYTLTYRVTCDSSRDGPVTIRAATTVSGGVTVPWLPRVGTSYFVTTAERDLGAFAMQIDYRFEDLTPGSGGVPGCTWIATYNYGPYDAGAFGPDPCLWPIRISYGAEKYQKVILVDYNDVPILNSADCPYQDPVQVDDSRSVITVKRNEPVKDYTSGGTTIHAFDKDKSELYRDKVNDAAWNGFAAKEVKVTSITAGDEQYDSNGQRYYYEVLYEFHINRDTWKSSILDQGKQVLDDAGEPTPLLTGEGNLIDEPVLLDGAGNELAAGGTPVFHDYDVYVPVDFTPLAIDFATAIGR